MREFPRAGGCGFCRKNAISLGRPRGVKKTPKSLAFSACPHAEAEHIDIGKFW